MTTVKKWMKEIKEITKQKQKWMKSKAYLWSLFGDYLGHKITY